MAPEDHISLSWCAPGDIPQVRELIGRHWRPGHVMVRDARLYAWQFHDPGRPQGLSVLLARRGGELVGHLGLIPGDFNLQGRRMPCRWTSLWFVTKQTQATGAGVALLRKAQEECGGLLGCLGYNQEALRVFGAMGFDLLPALPRWLRLGRASALHGLLAGSPQPYPPQVGQDLAQAAGRAALRPAPGLEVRDWASLGPRPWREAWERDLAPGGLGTWLDEDFITWRYVRHPVFRYTVRLVLRPADGRVLGLMVYRVQELAGRAEKVLRLLELACREEALDVLLQDLLARVEELGPAFVDFHCASQDLAPALERAGFLREESLPAMLPSLFQPLDFRQEPLPAALWAPRDQGLARGVLNSPGLYLTRGQGDQDRPN